MLLLVVSCPEPAQTAPLTPEQQKRYEEARSKLEKIRRETAWEQPFIEVQQSKDREELVRPAPPGFKPGKSSKKLKLTLIPQKTHLRKGERFLYRIELQNLGRKKINVQENFFKSGSLMDRGHFDLQLWLPTGEKYPMITFPPRPDFPEDKPALPPAGGKRASSWAPFGTSCEFLPSGWEKMSQEQREFEFKKYRLVSGLAANVRIDLAPGETLLSRGWRRRDVLYVEALWNRCEKADPPDPGPFRELYGNPRFDTPGKYRVQLILEDMPTKPPTEEDIKRYEKELGISRADQMANYKDISENHHLGLFKSNVVTFEVAP